MSGARRRRTWSYTEAAVHGHQFDCRTMFWIFGYATYCLCFQVVPISKNCLSKKKHERCVLLSRSIICTFIFYSPPDSVRFSLVNVIIIAYHTHDCCGNDNADSTGALHAIRHCHSRRKNAETKKSGDKSADNLYPTCVNYAHQGWLYVLRTASKGALPHFRASCGESFVHASSTCKK